MAIFNQPSAPKRDIPAPPEPSKPVETALSRTPDPGNEFNPGVASSAPRQATNDRGEGKESLIASDITIEGKIEGAGHVRIAGRFKGDVHVQGDLTIEVGAKVNGGVRARKVIVAGELEGNIESAQRVELLDSGVMIGDLKAETLLVAAGSRMKGQVEFGEKGSFKSAGGKGEPAASS
jgi:cytoskeletal protein CcmA (bactofilin family)